MGHRKTPNILVIVLLVLGVLTNSALAEACFCGEACLHVFQPNANISAKTLFHMRCTDVPCQSCQLEKGQTLKAANSRHHSFHTRILDTLFILSPFLDYQSSYDVLESGYSFHDRGAITSSPVYLQNLSILC